MYVSMLLNRQLVLSATWVDFQEMKKLRGKLPKFMSFHMAASSQYLLVDTASPTWAIDLYTAHQVVSPLFSEFKIEFANGCA